MDLKRFSALLSGLYDAAMDPAQWSVMAPQLADAFTAGSCGLIIQPAGPIALTANFDAKVVADYAAHYHKVDVLSNDVTSKAGLGKPLIREEFLSNADWRASEIYNDAYRRIGAFHVLGGALDIDTGVRGVIGIHRKEGEPDFEADDKRTLNLLIPHLTRALQINSRLGALDRQRRLSFEALQALDVGILVVGASARLLFANSVAEGVLRGGHGLSVHHGLLRVRDRAKDDALRIAIDGAATAALGQVSSAGGLVTLSRRNDRPPLSLLVCPLRPEALNAVPAQAAALIFVNDPSARPRPVQEAVAALWSLTPAEARLVTGLVEGDRLETYADKAQITLQTAKTHLKRVFAKTGFGRQSELVREVLTNPILRLRL